MHPNFTETREGKKGWATLQKRFPQWQQSVEATAN
jgi:hypothetical protein